MEDMVGQGKVHSLGVSNFDVDKLESLMDFAKVRPVINQVELNPNRRDSELLRLCRDLVSFHPALLICRHHLHESDWNMLAPTEQHYHLMEGMDCHSSNLCQTFTVGVSVVLMISGSTFFLAELTMRTKALHLNAC